MNYKNYSKDVQKYMKTLEKQLTAEYGFIAPEWEISLKMLADNYQIYNECLKQINEDGMMIAYQDKKGTLMKQKHPLFVPLYNAEAYIQKLTHQFTLTIMSKSRVKAPELNDPDDFLSTL